MKHLLLCSIAIASCLTGFHSRGQTFSIHFLGDTTDEVTGSAGVIAATGWNNIANTSFNTGNVFSSDGLLSVQLTLSGNGSANGWHTSTVADGGNGSLMRGYIDTGTTNSATLTFSGFAPGSYDIYLYTMGDAARPGNNGDWLPNYTVNSTTNYTATLGGSFAGFTEGGITSTNTNTMPPPVDFGNYIVVHNVTPVDGVITISANADTQTWRSPLNGVQIVAVPEPSVMILAAVGLTTIFVFGRKARAGRAL